MSEGAIGSKGASERTNKVPPTPLLLMSLNCSPSKRRWPRGGRCGGDQACCAHGVLMGLGTHRVRRIHGSNTHEPRLGCRDHGFVIMFPSTTATALPIPVSDDQLYRRTFDIAAHVLGFSKPIIVTGDEGMIAAMNA